MWSRVTSLMCLTAISCVSQAAQLNFLGDTLSAGQFHAASALIVKDSHSSAEFVAVANINATDDLVRGYRNANRKGYGFANELTLMYGLTDTINLGMRYGYAFDKHETKIDSSAARELEGDWRSEGGTDLTLLGKYLMNEGTALDVEVQLPVCSAESMSDLCTSTLAIPENSEQDGRSGGQGNGYYRVKTALGSNWVTELDTHWQGSIYGAITLPDDVFGEKVSSPFTYGASFGAIFPLKQNHKWTGTLSIDRMLEHSAYSEQLQREVSYGTFSRTSFTTEYFWDFMHRVQLKPFAQLSIVQLPSEKFQTNGQERTLEYTAGTEVTFGAEINITL